MRRPKSSGRIQILPPDTELIGTGRHPASSMPSTQRPRVSGRPADGWASATSTYESCSGARTCANPKLPNPRFNGAGSGENPLRRRSEDTRWLIAQRCGRERRKRSSLLRLVGGIAIRQLGLFRAIELDCTLSLTLWSSVAGAVACSLIGAGLGASSVSRRSRCASSKTLEAERAPTAP